MGRYTGCLNYLHNSLSYSVNKKFSLYQTYKAAQCHLQISTILRIASQCSGLQYSTVHYVAVLYCTVLPRSIVQYSRLQFCTVCDSTVQLVYCTVHHPSCDLKRTTT